MQRTLIDNPGPTAFLESTARFSPCGRYRYELFRRWHPVGKSCCFIMLNPSTADDRVLDPTVRRCVEFAKSWGMASLTVLNCFAWRATNPRDLRDVYDPVGEDNDRTIKEVAPLHDSIVCAWGTHALLRSFGGLMEMFDQDEMVRYYLEKQNLFCLGLTKDGFPKHPLYIPGNQAPCLMPKSRY